MKWINATDLKLWASRRDCQEMLPLLISKLIRYTSNSIININFPHGESIQNSGYDGLLEINDGLPPFVPKGVSVWEFGVSSNVRKKADEDYQKRTKNPHEVKPSETSFVFVTPHVFEKQSEWIEEKNRERIWKEVRVINGDLLELWLENSPPVGAWLATKEIGKFPTGIQSTEDFWEFWTAGSEFSLIPEILLGGREIAQSKIISSIHSPTIIPVQSISMDESLAFIISCFINDSNTKEAFLSKSLIVDNSESFKELISHRQPLILIPRFEDSGELSVAVRKGHSVIVPLGLDISPNWTEVIKLPRIQRNSFVRSLEKIGINREKAERLSKESTRNITILRRLLRLDRKLPLWAQQENISSIIPALIVGRWDESYSEDRETIARLAGESYENYIKKLYRWLYTSDSPIIKIDTTWRLTSPYDAWSLASKNVTSDDFKLLNQIFIDIIGSIDPRFDLQSHQRRMPSMFGKNREHSNWLRQGIVESLILIAVLGENFEFNLPYRPQSWVDNIIYSHLITNDSNLWKSFEGLLPLLAEASPKAFIDTLYIHLNKTPSPVLTLFEEEEGFLTSVSYYASLLWALEAIAWFPEYINDATLLLAKLSAKDTGGKLANRPFRSLIEIFKPWHYQTISTWNQRADALNNITQKEPDIGWNLLLSMITDANDIATQSHKVRWRLFDTLVEKPILISEYYETQDFVVDSLLSKFKHTEEDILQLVEKSVVENLSYENRMKLLDYFKSTIGSISYESNNTWNKIRIIIARSRTYPDARWALHESVLKKYEELYYILEPHDDINKIIWLFKENWPWFIEGRNERKISSLDYEKYISSKRVDALKNIWGKFGLEKILQEFNNIEEPWAAGDSIAHIIEGNIEEICLIIRLIDEKKISVALLHGFIRQKQLLHGKDWILESIIVLKNMNIPDTHISWVLMPLKPSIELFDFINKSNETLKSEYWTNVYPNFWDLNFEAKTHGIKQLIHYNRNYSAIDLCYKFIDEIPSDLIVEVLINSSSNKSIEVQQIQTYEVEQLFEVLYNRGYDNKEILIKLEWLYLPMYNYFEKRNHKLLHQELSENPGFFVELLIMGYKPDDDSDEDIVSNDLTEQQVRSRTINSHSLLKSWKLLPGVDSNGKINSQILIKWVDEVREIALKNKRLIAADIVIGELLAQYPETSEPWPPDAICDIIESKNSDDMISNFRAAVFNKRSYSSRGHLEGGQIERDKAIFYRNLASSHKGKHPKIFKVFEELAIEYEQEAITMDNHAERDRFEL